MPLRCSGGTALSAAEVGWNYKTVDDPSAFVAFPLVDEPETALVAWTTTPWTLPSNMYAAVHPRFDYVVVRAMAPDGGAFWLASVRAGIGGLAALALLAKSASAKVLECRIAPSGDTSPKRALVAPTSPTSQTVSEFAITVPTQRRSMP